jgi:hypothetical protein
MSIPRIIQISFAFALLGLPAFGEDHFTVTVDTYDAKLDDSSRAQNKMPFMGCNLTVKKNDFAKVQSEFNPKAFDSWDNKLKSVHPGMTMDQIKAILKPQEVEPCVCMGGILCVAIKLDDTYFVSGLFNSDWTLREMNQHPIAITYKVIQRIIEKKMGRF